MTLKDQVQGHIYLQTHLRKYSQAMLMTTNRKSYMGSTAAPSALSLGDNIKSMDNLTQEISSQGLMQMKHVTRSGDVNVAHLQGI